MIGCRALNKQTKNILTRYFTLIGKQQLIFFIFAQKWKRLKFFVGNLPQKEGCRRMSNI